MTLDNWGREAQDRVKSSRVLIAGAGGVGSAAAHHLLAAGVGVIRLVDESRVGLSDLSHQIVFRERDLGKPKALVAASCLRDINPFAAVEGQVKAITQHNVARLAAGFHLLLDATHHPTVSLLLNQAAVKFQVPLIHAWVWDLNGRIGTFWPGQGPCLACDFLLGAFTAQPALLGPLPGLLGALQALEALRILGGLGPALLGRLLIFNGAQFTFTEKTIRRTPNCPFCLRRPP